MGGDVRVAILGPLEVRVDDVPVQLAGDRLRAVLSRLAAAVPGPVGAGELIDAVWAGSPPADATHALQSLVSRLRTALGGPDAVLAGARGYRLPLARDAVDAPAFRDLLEQGRQEARAGRETRPRWTSSSGPWRSGADRRWPGWSTRPTRPVWPPSSITSGWTPAPAGSPLRSRWAGPRRGGCAERCAGNHGDLPDRLVPETSPLGSAGAHTSLTRLVRARERPLDGYDSQAASRSS
jgi:hypothetical protein